MQCAEQYFHSVQKICPADMGKNEKRKYGLVLKEGVENQPEVARTETLQQRNTAGHNMKTMLKILQYNVRGMWTEATHESRIAVTPLFFLFGFQ